MTEQVSTLLINGILVTMDAAFTVYEDGAVAIDGDSIVAVGATSDISSRYSAAEVVSCAGQVIMPGLVNAHTHIPMTLLRGLNDDLRLDVWLGYLMPLEREFVTPEFVKLGTQVACAEMIRSGITSFADMYYFEDAIAEETAVIGMRALLGQTILMFPAPDAGSYEDGLVLCRRFIERWHEHPLIQPAVAPHAWYTGTPKMNRACADLARAYDVPLHTHVGETALEAHNCQEHNHMAVVPWIEKHGLLETKLLAAHCVHLDESELFMLYKAGAGVAHCPTSNLKLASGIANVGKMLELNIKLGVGTDGPASNNDLDMFEEVRLAALLAKTKSNDPTVLPARQAVAAATIGGARALHMEAITGSVEVGKRADLAVVELDGIHNQPRFNNNPDTIYSQIVYAAKSTDVAHVMCNGRWLMRDKNLLTVDEAKAKVQAAKVAAEIDAFVLERESSPYNKLVLLAGVERQESFEVQVKVPVAHKEHILKVLKGDQVEITRKSHYRQFDTYFIFEDNDPDAARLRYREDEFMRNEGEVYQSRARLTLIGEEERQEFPNAVMLSRSRFLANADRTLRFYREYFAPEMEIDVQKERLRWRVVYKDTDFAINLDELQQPKLPGYYLEIKSRTWSRTDAERKASLITELLELFGIDPKTAERGDYPLLALATS
ncbi:MAG: amidohydrolase [Chloroflexi bacterium]|nr:MAG: amidohydrolase [Chloroflexota bacterium]PIE80715.1 MAG: amidohydrolase [Chloroflexota bacterium]